MQIVNNLLDYRAIGAWENKRIRLAFRCGRRNNQVLEQKSRLMSYQRVSEIDRARKLASYEKEFARFFSCRDERAEEIRRNSSTAPANAPGCPCNCFTQDIVTVENKCESIWQDDR